MVSAVRFLFGGLSMRRTILAALITVLVLGAHRANAAPDPNETFELRGSDTMYELTREIIDSCGGIHYVGGGSALGLGEIRAENQQIAPMSRFLDENTGYRRTSECDFVGPNLVAAAR